MQPAIEGEAPRGRARHSCWLIPGKNRLLVTLGEQVRSNNQPQVLHASTAKLTDNTCLTCPQARDADRIWVLEWAPRPPLAVATWTRVLETAGVPPYP